MEQSKHTLTKSALSQGNPSHIICFYEMMADYCDTDPPKIKKTQSHIKRVRSIQCTKTAAKKTARTWAVEYFSWLQTSTLGIIQTGLPENGEIRFRAGGVTLLGMKEASFRDVNLSSWIIHSGLLLHPEDRNTSISRFTFLTTEINGNDILFTAVEEYAPALPWRLYRLTQGLIHPVVMNRFGHRIGKPAGTISCPKDRCH